MSIELRPMRADEFPEWKADSVASYSADMQENGGMPRDAADGRIELNVMGGNEVARGLYRGLGYDEVAVYMGKTL
jgi:hypothetical protein